MIGSWKRGKKVREKLELGLGAEGKEVAKVHGSDRDAGCYGGLELGFWEEDALEYPSSEWVVGMKVTDGMIPMTSGVVATGRVGDRADMLPVTVPTGWVAMKTTPGLPTLPVPKPTTEYKLSAAKPTLLASWVHGPHHILIP